MLQNIVKLNGIQKLRKNEQQIINGSALPRCISNTQCEEFEECMISIGQCI